VENVEWSPVSSAPLAGVVQRGRMAGILSASGSFDHVDGLITYRSLIKRGCLDNEADRILSDSSGMFLTRVVASAEMGQGPSKHTHMSRKDKKKVDNGLR